ncbi:hypothetical protein MMC17_002348 [Xylographa soralifera]|nr:hypothetical protein [Xylographa soralifera]
MKFQPLPTAPTLPPPAMTTTDYRHPSTPLPPAPTLDGYTPISHSHNPDPNLEAHLPTPDINTSTLDIEAQPLHPASSYPPDPTTTSPAEDKATLLGILAFFLAVILTSLVAAFLAHFLKYLFLFWRAVVVGAFVAHVPDTPHPPEVTTLVGEGVTAVLALATKTVVAETETVLRTQRVGYETRTVVATVTALASGVVGV